MNRRPTKSELAKLDALKDEDIDMSDIPELGPEFWAKAQPVRRKTLTSVRYDNDVLAWFKAQGKGYQSRMNAVLRAYVDSQGSKTPPTGSGGRRRKAAS